jgi:hypothetical protein
MWDDGSFDLWDLRALHEQLSALGSISCSRVLACPP